MLELPASSRAIVRGRPHGQWGRQGRKGSRGPRSPPTSAPTPPAAGARKQGVLPPAGVDVAAGSAEKPVSQLRPRTVWQDTGRPFLSLPLTCEMSLVQSLTDDVPQFPPPLPLLCLFGV